MRRQQCNPSEAGQSLPVECFRAPLAAKHYRPLAVFHAREPGVVGYHFFADHALGMLGRRIMNIEMTHAVSFLLFVLRLFPVYQLKLNSFRPRGSLRAAASPPAQLTLAG